MEQRDGTYCVACLLVNESFHEKGGTVVRVFFGDLGKAFKGSFVVAAVEGDFSQLEVGFLVVFVKFQGALQGFVALLHVVVGSAFSGIVNSFVNDVIMPLVGILTGGVNFSDQKATLKAAVMDGETVVKEAVTLNYGAFIQAIVNFFIIALSVFIVVRVLNKAKDKLEEKKKAEEAAAAAAAAEEAAKKAAEEAAAHPSAEALLTEIRDLLKNKG